MQTHPFIESVANRIGGFALTGVIFLVYALLLYCNGQESGWITVADSLVSVSLLAVAGFLYGYIDGMFMPGLSKYYWQCLFWV